MDLSRQRPQNASKIAAEFAAGVKLDVSSAARDLRVARRSGCRPLDAMMICPKSKDAKTGGVAYWETMSDHRSFSFIADAGTGGFWYNTKC